MADVARERGVPTRNALRLLRARISRLERDHLSIGDQERLHDQRVRAIEARIAQINAELAVIALKEAAE
jgi:hypothetical protein